MDQSRTVVIAATAATVAALGGWFGLPLLQNSQAAVDREVSLHVERARRLMDNYDPRLAYAALIREQLRAADVDVDLKESAELADSAADTYQAVHGELWTSFEPVNWQVDPPRVDRPSYGSISQDMRQGASAFRELADANEQVLDEALAEVDRALTVSIGDALGRNDPEANQLKASLLYQKGLHAQVHAALLRNESLPVRDQLVGMANEAAHLQSQANFVATSGIEGTIESVRKTLADTEASLRAKQEELAELERLIKGLEDQHATAVAQAEQAGGAMDKLTLTGLSFSDPRGADAFRDQMGQLSRVYMEGLRQAHMLEHGGYPKAEIDFSGDYLRGLYLEDGQAGNLTVDKGLKHRRAERAILSAKIASEQAAVTGLQDDLAQLQRTREEYVAARTDATVRLEQLAPAASETFTDLNRLDSEAFATEDTALNLFDQVADLHQQVARLADQWVAQGREKTQALSPETMERSAFQRRLDDGWMAGQAQADQAAAGSSRAWVYYARYQAAVRNGEALTGAAQYFNLDGADAGAERRKAQEAREAGIEEIKQAMAVLEKAHRGLGKHWTVAAQSAGTVYLLALLGETDYTADAVQHYRNAIKGRENEPFTEPFANRLARLENRGGAAARPSPEPDQPAEPEPAEP